MTAGLARPAATLAALVSFLGRGGAPEPGALAVAGVVGLAVYAALAVGGPLVQRLLAAPPRPAPAEAGTSEDEA